MLLLVTYQNRIFSAHKQTVMPHKSVLLLFALGEPESERQMVCIYTYIVVSRFFLSPLFLSVALFYLFFLSVIIPNFFLLFPMHNTKG